MELMDIIVIGLGNPLLTDDGVGTATARLLKDVMDEKGVAVEEASVGGMELVEMLLGFERAVIIDSIKTKEGSIGDIHRLTPGDIPTRNVNNLHNVGMVQALEMWRELGGSVPDNIVIYAVEAGDVHTFSESLTPPVEAALPRVVELVKKEVENWLGHHP